MNKETYKPIIKAVSDLRKKMTSAPFDLDDALAHFRLNNDVRDVVRENVGEVNADTLRGMANGYLLASISASTKHRLYPYDKGQYDYEAKLDWLDGVLHAVKNCDLAEQCLAELASRPPAKAKPKRKAKAAMKPPMRNAKEEAAATH